MVLGKKRGAAGFFLVMAALTALSAVFASCATVDRYETIDRDVARGDYDAFLRSLAESQNSKKPLYNEKNSVSLFLDKGLVEHYAEKWRDSRDSLGNADRLMREAETKSVTEGVASWIVNDTAKEYPGEDYENIYLNVFNALNYYHTGENDEAMVEIRNLTEPWGKLATLAEKYAADTKKAGAALAEVGGSNVKTAVKAPLHFSDSALAHYAAALFYRADGNEDGARIEFDKIEGAFARQTAVYSNPLPASIAEESEKTSDETKTGLARVNFLSFTGLGPQKIAVSIPIYPTAGMYLQLAAKDGKNERLAARDAYLLPAQAEALSVAQPVLLVMFAVLRALWTPRDADSFLYFAYEMAAAPQLKLPVLKRRPSRVNRIDITLTPEQSGSEGGAEGGYEGGSAQPVTYSLELLENMGSVMEQTYNARFTSLLLKTATRTIVKYSSAFIAAAAVAQSSGDDAGLLTLLAAQKTAELSEKADTRAGRYFPDKAFVGGVSIPPGQWTATWNYYAGGSLVETRTKSGIAVRAGSLNLIEDTCLK